MFVLNTIIKKIFPYIIVFVKIMKIKILIRLVISCLKKGQSHVSEGWKCEITDFCLPVTDIH